MSLSIRTVESVTVTAEVNNLDEDELYNWSSLRSQYLAEANNQMANEYYGVGYDPGWFWGPYAFGYTYMGMEPFASPFGWGYYHFGWAGRSWSVSLQWFPRRIDPMTFTDEVPWIRWIQWWRR